MLEKKKRVRNMTWKDYGITKYRYVELKAFCLQYKEKKKKIQNVMCKKDCEMIEQAAKAASEELYLYIIKSVTNDLSYTFIEYDEMIGRIPIGKTDFYGYRRLFYHYLDLIKNGDKSGMLS